MKLLLVYCFEKPKPEEKGLYTANISVQQKRQWINYIIKKPDNMQYMFMVGKYNYSCFRSNKYIQLFTDRINGLVFDQSDGKGLRPV
jgi:hypothetical protein